MIVREERIGDCRLLQGDCMEIMPMFDPVDAVVTDPPYGIGEGAEKTATRQRKTSKSTALADQRNYAGGQWDQSPASRDCIALIRAMSDHQIIFGGNYFEGLPPTSCWLVWDKENGANDFADCELAWTNLKKAVRRLKWLWNGMIRKGDDVREHPTQKPVGVMNWCIGHLPEKTETILDPFAGSGSTGVAAVQCGKRFIGIERDPEYFEIMCRRIDEACRQPADLFVAPPAAPIQEELL